MVLQLQWSFITPPPVCLCSLPWTGKHPPSGLHVCGSYCAAPQCFYDLSGQNIGGRTPAASRFSSLHVWHLLCPAGHPGLRAGSAVAAAPRWSLEGVESQQLAQSALSGLPAWPPAAEHGAEPHHRSDNSVHITVCCCSAPLGKADNEALHSLSIVLQESQIHNSLTITGYRLSSASFWVCALWQEAVPLPSVLCGAWIQNVTTMDIYKPCCGSVYGSCSIAETKESLNKRFKKSRQ